MKPSEIRDSLRSQNYQQDIPTDLRQFPHMVNAKDPNLERRVDWVIAIEKRHYIPKATPGILPPMSKSGFDRVYQELEKDQSTAGVKIAECSNFAYHATSILLSEPKVTDEYNVCIAGIGGNQHNVVLLLPKSARPIQGSTLTDMKLPPGSLIVDPWAMAMGYSAEESLAVTPKEYVYSEMLDEVVLGYQSINDSQVTSRAESPQSSPRSPSSIGTLSPAPISSSPPSSTFSSPGISTVRHSSVAARPSTAPVLPTSVEATKPQPRSSTAPPPSTTVVVKPLPLGGASTFNMAELKAKLAESRRVIDNSEPRTPNRPK